MTKRKKKVEKPNYDKCLFESRLVVSSIKFTYKLVYKLPYHINSTIILKEVILKIFLCCNKKFKDQI